MYSWDERRDLIVEENQEQALTFCANQWVEIYEESVANRGAFFVALSGGSTPKALFALITKPPYSTKIDWSKVHLFWGDERSVPATDSESNYHMAMTAGFSAMPIPPSQIHRMEAEKAIEEKALEYERLIASHLQGKGFDLIMLGMGEDGHTASLFPGTKGLLSTDRLVIANHVPQKNTWRMSFTYECINQASHISIYVLGESKQEILKKVLSSTSNTYPIEKIGTKEHKATWIVDAAAAQLLQL
jgi:6-phosphogluconolactonase